MIYMLQTYKAITETVTKLKQTNYQIELCKQSNVREREREREREKGGAPAKDMVGAAKEEREGLRAHARLNGLFGNLRE
jgi:hypothetical protein